MDHPVRPERPSSFADRPARPRGDLLSALLRSVRLRGEDISGFVGVPRVAYEGNAGALHLIEEGTAWLELRPGEPEVLQTGDLALIANGASHHVAAKSANARWITGTFEFDQLPRNALIDGLPALVVLRNPEVSGLEWFDVSRRLLLKERDTPTQGSSVMISRILDLMFVQILRAWAVGPQAEAGWLQAGLDADISRALDAIHAHPGRPWTTASLATEANLSRSSFVVRFGRSMGEPPMAYLTRTRMAMARALLRDTNTTVRQVAIEVGYGSEAAFTRAFAREHGQPPSRWRRSPDAG